MKACSTTLIKNSPIEKGLPYFNGVITNIELRIREGHFTLEDRAHIENLKKSAKKQNINIVSLHQTMKSRGIKIDLSSPDKWVRNFSVRDAEKTLIAADILGAKRVILHPSDVIEEKEFPVREEILKNSLNEIIESAQRLGIEIYIENLRNGKMGNSLNWLFSLKKDLSNKIDICFDTGHWLLSKKDSENFNNFKHYHIHDNNGKKDEHLFPGEGIFPWNKIKFPENAIVVYELMPDNKPQKKLKKIKEDHR